ncbi:hypothetical protein [Pseudomonas syringae]|uniref:hypothetical protein n=1 Tax=Pseudomonas syringae TaxID=317 RepID=UPI001F417AB3|nr:hypothetical protein [Pseudomonas syringae]MCF9001446.1 hypothetical protein [Pseudomonas syringae]
MIALRADAETECNTVIELKWDGIRLIPDLTVPTADEVKSYELFMRGMSDEQALELFKDFEEHPSSD